MENILVIFDDQYSHDSTFVHSYLSKIAEDTKGKYAIDVVLSAKYRGPRIGGRFNFVKIHRWRKKRAFQHPSWASNVHPQHAGILSKIAGGTSVESVICFGCSPLFLATVAKWVHIFHRKKIPQIVLVTPATKASPEFLEDFERLNVTLLQDADFPRPGDESQEPLAGATAKQIPFQGLAPLRFHSEEASSFRFTQGIREIDWLHWLDSAAARPRPPKDVVLFVRPDWMKSGSGSTFAQLGKYFREQGSLLIDVAIHPHPNNFTSEDRKQNVLEEQRTIGGALYFSVRQSRWPFKYLKLALNALRWRPSSVTNQWLLFFSLAIVPKEMRRLIARADVTLVYLNHFFTYLYARRLIGNEAFILDTHDIQSINQHHHHYLNIFTRRLDKFGKAVKHEFEIVKKAHRAIFVSKAEMRFAEQFMPADKMRQVIMLPSEKPLDFAADGGIIRLLVVASAHPGNLRGVTWLLDAVWPLVKERLSNELKVELQIVGSIDRLIDAKRYSSLAEISFKGVVEDLEQYYRKANIILLPVISGGGVGIKSIEAVLQDKPIVATTHSLRGIAEAGELALPTADSAVSFARDILDLATSKAARDTRRAEFLKLAQYLQRQPYLENLEAVIEQSRLGV